MSYPLILPYEEQDERHKFSNFLWRVFDPARETNTQFEGSLTAEALFNIYKTYKVDTMLTTDMIAHTIMYGGYMTAQGELYFRIKPDIFKDLPAATQEKILSYCNYAKSLSLRQIMMGHDPAAVDRGMVLNESFRHFIQTQIFTPTFKFWKSIPKGQRKTGTKELYEYYSWWCFQFGYKPEDKASFLNLCKNLGYKIKRGYYKGVSGGNIVENVVIPQTEEERKLTIQYEGLGVICLQGYTLFNDSTATKDYTKLGLKAYIQNRRCISSAKSYAEKKREEEKETQQQAISSRSRTEVSQNSLSGRTQKVSQTEEPIGVTMKKMSNSLKQIRVPQLNIPKINLPQLSAPKVELPQIEPLHLQEISTDMQIPKIDVKTPRLTAPNLGDLLAEIIKRSQQ